MQRDGKSLVKRNNPESQKASVLMPEHAYVNALQSYSEYTWKFISLNTQNTETYAAQQS